MKRTRLFVILMCAIMVFCMASVMCSAADYTKYSSYKTGKTTDAVNVRASASKSGTIIKTVDEETRFTLFGYKKSGGIKWYRVKYKGKAGYVSSSYVKVITPLKYILYTPYKKGKVTASKVNVRKGAGTSYARLGTQSKGTIYTLKGYKTVSGKKWYRITYKGKAGYICSDFVDITASNTATSSKYVAYSSYKTVQALSGGAAVRKNASSSAGRYTTIKAGNKASIWGYKKVNGVNWYRTYYKGSIAYVKSSSVKIVTRLPYAIYTPYKTGKVVSGGVDVMGDASVSSSNYGKIQGGTSITLKGYKETGGTKWYRITYDGKAAYVIASKITIQNYLSYEIYTPYKSVKADFKLNVRNGPSTSYTSAGTISKDSYITIRGYKINSLGNKWYRITYNNKSCYIYAASVTAINTLPYIAYTPYLQGKALADTVAMSDASKDSTSYGTVKKDSRFTLKGYTYDSNGNKWYRIVYDGKAAYVRADDVTKSPDYAVLSYLTVDCSSLNVRSGAGTKYDIIGNMVKGDTAEAKLAVLSSTGSTWYKISYNGKAGYVNGGSNYVNVNELSLKDSNDFEAYMVKQGFPESYKPYLRKLHEAHPSWIFKAQKTGISWNTAVSGETKLGESLYEGGYDSWKSMAKGSYDFKNNKYVTFDGRWYNAYSGLTKYYLDPRNYMNESYIYAFLDQSFDSSTQSISTVHKMVKGSFLDKDYPGSAYKTYSSCIYYAAKAAGMNANVLASMIIQEQGWEGTSDLISGKYPGYKGYYNYLNIGAFHANGMTAVERGLWYAKLKGWNTRAKAIKGGANYYAEGYIKAKQNTLYLKKFNVMNGASNVGQHQYMTNVAGAAGEGNHMKTVYADLKGEKLVFSIPVFSSMPASAVNKPTTKGNNNNLLDSLKVANYSFKSSFARYTQSYEVTVPASVKTIKVSAAANYSGASVSGTGTITLNDGTNYVKVKCKSTSGLTRTYTIKVIRN